MENGLRPFESLEATFDPAAAAPAVPCSIPERMRHYATPGASVAVIRHGRIAWTRAYGVLDASTGVPTTTSSIFQAASTSKLVTAVTVLRLVQEGLLDPDADVNRYLASWKVPDGPPTETRRVTLRGLLTHTAGLPATNYAHDGAMGIPTLLDVVRGAPPALNRPAVPEHEPGTRWQYSNVAFDLVQLLLEDVTGEPFHELAGRLVLGPLGMDRSSFVYPLDESVRADEARPHDAEGTPREPAMHPTAVAHAGLTTTPADLARFTLEIIRASRGESDLLLSRSMAELLLTPQWGIPSEVFGIPVDEGLGVILRGEGRERLFAHPGSNLPGLNCWLIGWPGLRAGVVVMTNGARGELLCMEVCSAVLHQLRSESGSGVR